MGSDTQVRLYYLFRAFSSAFFYRAFLVFYYQARGLSFAQMGLLQSVFSASVILFEVPTGLWADRVGRRKIMGLGVLIMSIASGAYWFATDFWIFVILESLLALGLTLTSGADAAFIYDHLKKQGRAEAYAEVEARASAAKYLMLSISGVAGGALAMYDVRYLFPASAAVMFTGFIIARLMRHGLRYPGSRESGPIPRDDGQPQSITVGFIWAVAYSAVVSILLRAGDTVIQPVLHAHGVTYMRMGLAVGIGSLAASAGAYFLSSRLSNRRFRDPIVWMLPVTLSIGYLLLPFGPPILMLALLSLHYSAHGLHSPITKTLLNAEINHSSVRATLLSTENAFKRFILAMVMPAVGFFMDSYGVEGGVLFCALLGILGTSLLFLLRVSERKRIA